MYFILELFKNIFFVWSIVITTALYFILTINHGYWASRNVKYIRPLPFFGNSFLSAFSIVPISKVQQDQYNYFKGQPYGGIWGFWKPKLLIIDPRLVEHVMIKDFSYFTDRDTTADVKTDPLTRHLVNENGNSWKVLRSKLTPVFSSGKLKTMIQQIIECTEISIQYISQKAATGNPLEIREEIAGFTMDVIASCAFGVNLNTIQDKNSVFRQLGRIIFSSSRMMKLRGILSPSFSSVIKLFSWRRVPKGHCDYFENMIENVIKHRVENNVHRNDFIQLMMEVRKEEEKQLKDGTISKIVMDDNTIMANAFVFLVAGFETTANTLSALLYELSANPDVQEKVYKEVGDVLKKHDGEITWEGIAEMKYTEMAINETLRKYPPVIDVLRKSVKPYKMPNSDLELPTGSVVLVPIYSLHHDSEYYPDPEKFEPERFSEENKHKLVKCTYLPFGEGPRICIGLRFAKMEMKIAIARLLTKYKLILNSKTISPLQFTKDTLFLVPEGGLWIDFIPRINPTK